MPPIQQQQTSRAGLITALVISIICALGFLVWAIMESSAATKERQAKEVLQTRYKDVISDSRLGDITNLRTAFGAQQPSVSVLDAAESQRKNLVKMITGTEDGNAAKTMEDLAAQIAKSPALKDAQVPSTSLAGMVAALTKKAESDASVIQAAQAAAKQAADNFKQELDKKEQQVATYKAASEKAAADAAKAQADAQAAIAEKQKQVDDFSTQMATLQKARDDAQAQAGVDVQTIQRQLETVKKQLDQAQIKLAQYRMDVKNPMIRAADARITQVAPDSICYIDLGYGDHLMPGLTFEIYDRVDGIPPLGDGMSKEDLPKGKASIEVLNVGQNSSQCRVIRVTQGQTLSQGDLCANLVYDRNIKPVFYVYGKFDTDQNNVATDQETENIKNLIQRWGGRLSDKLNIDVDYVIMGKEPTLPNYTKEDIEQSPVAKQRMDEANAALKAYDEVRGQASTMHIPVMNQNRFLYYTGFFDVAKR
jgi:hypothetical protein